MREEGKVKGGDRGSSLELEALAGQNRWFCDQMSALWGQQVIAFEIKEARG